MLKNGVSKMSTVELKSVRSLQPSEQKELAARVAWQDTAPEEVLRTLVQETLNKIIHFTRVSVTSDIHKKVWSSIYEVHRREIRNIFLKEVCLWILAAFSEEALSKMLEEHRSTGRLKNEPYGSRLAHTYSLMHSSAMIAVVRKAKSLESDVYSEVFDALEAEGIRY